MSGILIILIAGYVPTFYIVVPSMFLLNLTDTVFARAVCYIYYRRMNAELPSYIQSVYNWGVMTY